jgi:hypothetical protein
MPPVRLRFHRAMTTFGNEVRRAMMAFTGSGRELVPLPRRFMLPMCDANRQLPDEVRGAFLRPVITGLARSCHALSLYDTADLFHPK